MPTLRRPDVDVPQTPSPRLFTVVHARQTLPLVRKVVADIVRTWHTFNNPTQLQAPAAELIAKREQAKERLQELILELVEIGCLLKDWRMGLVDFMALYQGRQVELCWKHGEETITTWHEMGVGFTGRQPLTPEFEQQVEREVRLQKNHVAQASCL